MTLPDPALLKDGSPIAAMASKFLNRKGPIGMPAAALPNDDPRRLITMIETLEVASSYMAEQDATPEDEAVDYIRDYLDRMAVTLRREYDWMQYGGRPKEDAG